MHQPDYRDLTSGEYRLPWTYLHAIKDYVDMAAHLEMVPEARAVINFAPVLLDQIADYVALVDDYLHHDQGIRDPVLASLTSAVLPENPDACLHLFSSLIRANCGGNNWSRLIAIG